MFKGFVMGPTLRPLNFMLAGFLLLSASISQASPLDVDKFKASIIHTCSNESNSKLKIKCIVEASKRVSLIEQISETTSGRKIVSTCVNTVNLNLKRSLYDFAYCVEEQKDLKDNHPFPIWLGLNLEISKLRANWVSNCFSRVGQEVSKCVESQNLGFSMFWQEYVSLKKGDEQAFTSISKCLSGKIKETNFSRYVSCRRFRM